jgi:hypothetical protein
MSDPYAAAVGGYLLLKLRRFDLLHEWPRNLAQWVQHLPDGCVLWASQLIEQHPDREQEIRDMLLTAVERGVPVYTEGVRLLIEGLRLLGADGRQAHKALSAKLGQIVWDSPVTAMVTSPQGARAQLRTSPTTFDIEFGAPV